MHASVEAVETLLKMRPPAPPDSVAGALKRMFDLLPTRTTPAQRELPSSTLLAFSDQLKQSQPPSVTSDLRDMRFLRLSYLIADSQVDLLATTLLEKHVEDPDVEIVSVHSLADIKALRDAGEAVSTATMTDFGARVILNHALQELASRSWPDSTPLARKAFFDAERDWNETQRALALAKRKHEEAKATYQATGERAAKRRAP